MHEEHQTNWAFSPISNFHGNFCYSNFNRLLKISYCHHVMEFRLQITIQAIIQISHRISVPISIFPTPPYVRGKMTLLQIDQNLLKVGISNIHGSMFIVSVNYQNAGDSIWARDSRSHILRSQLNEHLDFANNITIKTTRKCPKSLPQTS